MGTRRIEITVETYEILMIRQDAGDRLVWCAACQETVLALPPEAAAVVVADNPRAIYRWVESGRVHFTESPEGRLLICLKSLLPLQKETLP